MSDIKPIETIYNGYRFRSRLEARWAVFFDALGIEYEYEPEGFEIESGLRYLPDFRIKCYGKRGANQKKYDWWICEGCKHCVGYDNSDISYWLSEFCNAADYTPNENGYPSIPEWLEIREDHTEILNCAKREDKDLDNPFDLYIEVKGVMTQEDANKIHEFSKHYPVLIVGNIPNPETYNARSEDLQSYEYMNDVEIYAWNYETIDGDYFACYPAVKDGKFYLDGDDSNYSTMDVSVIRDAFLKSRQARFEYGEKPFIK